MFNSDIQKVYEEIEHAQKAITDLRLFVRLAWHVIEPGSPYVHGWHIDAICEHLMAISSGQIKELLINVPPRHAKSSIVSVIYPVWEWISKPSLKWLFSSYAQSLSTRDSLKSRRLIQSPWFKKHYGDRFQLSKDQKTKMRYDNDRAGYRIATSVTGSNTGEGGDRIVCLPYSAQISMKFNSMPIGRICEQKLFLNVHSYNRFKKKIEIKPIIRHFITECEELITITMIDNVVLQATPNHLIFTGNGFMKARDITEDDSLFREDIRYVKVKSVTSTKANIKTYNIEVEGNNNYFANGYLVHNCDDGNNAAEGESKAILESTAIWWKEVMSTRKNDPKNSARIVIAQRISSLDISQVYLETANPVHLCLPAEYEGNKHVNGIGWSDPRNEIGELLWPERFNRQILEDLKKQLGSYGVAGQLQQRPVPREGGIIKNEWIKRFKITRDMFSRITNVFDFIVQIWDTAFKEGEENDYSCCITMGINKTGFYILNRWMERVSFPELEKMTIELANIYNPHQLVIEDKASGQSLIQSLRKRTKLPIKTVSSQKDKIVRCYAVSPLIEAGHFYVPEGEPWSQDYIDNLTKFPGTVHDDDVDCTIHGLTEYGIKKDFVGITTKNKDLGSIMGR